MFESKWFPTGWGLCSTQTSFSKFIITITLPTFRQAPLTLMINPFISNQNQYLFRKNYQVINRANEPTPTFHPVTDLHLQHLQSRNPFNSKSPTPVQNSNPFSSPRPQSVSIGPLKNSQSRYLPGGKVGLLQEADAWKRQIERKQRQKVQVYGAQGLRYNAYLGVSQQRKENNDYYQPTAKPLQFKSSALGGKRTFDQTGYGSYQSPKQRANIPKAKTKPRAQYFHDQMEEQSPNFNLIDPRKETERDRNSDSVHSKGNDMFQSQFDDHYKRSMQYGSTYGNGTNDMVDSRGYHHKNSRIQDQIGIQMFKMSDKIREDMSLTNRMGHSSNFYRNQSMESSVHRLDLVTPESISIKGQTYYRIKL